LSRDKASRQHRNGLRYTNHESSITFHQSPFSVTTIEFQKLYWWRLLELEAEAPGDLPQRVIEVRQMIYGHVAHEGAAYFVVTRATVQPAQKDEKLDA